MAKLEPLAGFEWSRVVWGAPDEVRTTVCSYCRAPLAEEAVPLILASADGSVAEFCDECQRTWWGFEIVGVLDEQEAEGA